MSKIQDEPLPLVPICEEEYPEDYIPPSIRFQNIINKYNRPIEQRPVVKQDEQCCGCWCSK